MLDAFLFEMFQNPVIGLFGINTDVEMGRGVGREYANDFAALHGNQCFLETQQR